MKGMTVFAVIAILIGVSFAALAMPSSKAVVSAGTAVAAAPAAVTISMDSNWNNQPSCFSPPTYTNNSVNMGQIATQPGMIGCSATTYYYCVDTIRLTPAAEFKVAGVTTTYPILYDPIGIRDSGTSQQIRNAPRGTWTPKVFIKVGSNTCYNWMYVTDAELPMSPIEPITLTEMPNSEYPVGTGLQGGLSYRSNSMGSGSTEILTFREIGSGGVDTTGIPIYDLGIAGGWGFRPSSASSQLYFYRGYSASSYSKVTSFPFPTDKGTSLSVNTLSHMDFNMAVQTAKQKK
ncbi:MAG: hypothetical protein NTV88_02870 [Candidatus Micrarchaeota archaeon]|nr:hypothetical protein [Candidatus Micrarchaeota archaeon]